MELLSHSYSFPAWEGEISFDYRLDHNHKQDNIDPAVNGDGEETLPTGGVAEWGGDQAKHHPLPLRLTHHGGATLTGNIDLAILWYGLVPKLHRDRILSFIKSLNGSPPQPQPSVTAWWVMVESYQAFVRKPVGPIIVNVVSEVDDVRASLGKVLIKDFIWKLLPIATKGRPNTLVIIVAAEDVSVANMCAGKCAQHGNLDVNGRPQPFVLVGNPVNECPECAWPFVSDIHNPRGMVLKPPSGNLAADAMVMSLAGGLLEAAINPFGDGFYGNMRGEDVEAFIACKGIFGSGSRRGDPGKHLIDPVTGGAYNVYGADNNKFLVPAIFNPKNNLCWTPL
ncbi:protein EXORDIUM-like 6 [Senna tora]|uniref:Protein EXORDIUM-like 6 n=1 Tax=Senna tora TaxID=362788 RepID=A0A834XDL6_9FABA|nr:protein EXORDIUM-like 6 [Senna tora]